MSRSSRFVCGCLRKGPRSRGYGGSVNTLDRLWKWKVDGVHLIVAWGEVE